MRQEEHPRIGIGTGKETDMKKQVVCLLAAAVMVMFVPGFSPASTLEDLPFSFGPKMGLNISDFRGIDMPSEGELLDWKAGFCGGAFLAYPINDWFTVQPELLYSMKGMKVGFLVWSAGISLDYIEIPLLAMLTIPTESRFTPNIFVGPAFGFNVRAEVFVGEIGDTDVFDLEDAVKFYEIGFVFGIGANIEVGPGEIMTDIRYIMGLTDVFDIDASEDSFVDAKNDVIAIMLGYGF